MDSIDEIKTLGLRAAFAAGGALAGAPWWAIIILVLALVLLDLAWAALQRPDLAHRWLDVRDRVQARQRR